MRKNVIITASILLFGAIIWLVYQGIPTKDVVTNINTSGTYHASPIAGESAGEIVNYAIALNEFSFDPNRLQAEPGEVLKIKLTNKGNAVHNFVIDELGVDSGILQPGGSTILTITAPLESATYEIYCSIADHRELGMVSTYVVVNEAVQAPSSQSTVGTYQALAPQAFKDFIETEDILVIDVHIPEQTHIKGTDEVIPYTDIASIEESIVTSGSKRVAVYCRSGGMSREVSDALVAKGYDVFDLAGGRNAWVSVGLN